MANVIWKFPLKIAAKQAFLMPQGAQILTVEMQPGIGVVMWAIVDPDMDKRMCEIAMYGTNHPLPANPGVYLKTVQLDSAIGMMAWHFFHHIGVRE